MFLRKQVLQNQKCMYLPALQTWGGSYHDKMLPHLSGVTWICLLCVFQYSTFNNPYASAHLCDKWQGWPGANDRKKWRLQSCSCSSVSEEEGSRALGVALGVSYKEERERAALTEDTKGWQPSRWVTRETHFGWKEKQGIWKAGCQSRTEDETKQRKHAPELRAASCLCLCLSPCSRSPSFWMLIHILLFLLSSLFTPTTVLIGSHVCFFPAESRLWASPGQGLAFYKRLMNEWTRKEWNWIFFESVGQIRSIAYNKVTSEKSHSRKHK